MKTGKRIGTASLLMGMILTCLAHTASADIQLHVNLDREQIAMNEQAVLTVTISGSGTKLPDPQLPGLGDFQVSNAGTSQNYSWVNGAATASVTHTFVLTPKQEGSFMIPPVRIQVDGKTIESNALKLAVVKGNTAALPATPVTPPSSGNPSQGPPAVFITATVDKPSPYVGEPVTYSFRLYNRAAFTRQPQYQPPNTSGFWTEDLPPQRNFNASVKGVPYQVVEVRTALFPIHPGNATIGSAALNVALQNFSNDPFGNDFFSSFFSGGQEKTLRADPIALQVKSLPTPAPAGFNGAVGEYSLSAALDKTSAQVGQPLTLTVTISGRGNIKSLPDVTLPALTNFRTFDANAATNIEKKDYKVQGSKVYKTVLIPTASGDLILPPISFVYFDPSARAYKTLKSRALPIQVKPAPAGTSPATYTPLPGAANAPGIKVLNEDIRYIQTPASISSQGVPIYKRVSYRWFNLLAFVIFIVSGMVPLDRQLFLSNPALLRFKGAKNQAGTWIKEAESAIGRSDLSKAGSFLGRSLQTYVSAKLDLAESGTSLKTALERLQARGVSASTQEKLKHLWHTLDLFQFAPAQVRAEDLRESIQRLREGIAALEKELPWKD